MKMKEKDMDYLKRGGFTPGLIQAMAALRHSCAKKIWILDNSQAMGDTRDGHRIGSQDNEGRLRFEECSRWEELEECVRDHIRLAGVFRIPSSFRFLNNPEATFSVGPTPDAEDIETQVQKGLAALKRAKPHGDTPLTAEIIKLQKEIEEMKEELQSTGKHVTITLCTDGVPSDTSKKVFKDNLRRLKGLPVHLIVRLCTDEPSVVDFYNNLDTDVKDLSIDILDDFQTEAVEICEANPWLNYAIPIHRAREMGFNSPVLDLLDEKPLSHKDRMELCGLLFGKDKMLHWPDADADWSGFTASVRNMQEAEDHFQWDPIEGEMKPLVNFDLLKDPGDKLSKMRKLKKKKKLRWFKDFIHLPRKFSPTKQREHH